MTIARENGNLIFQYLCIGISSLFFYIHIKSITLMRNIIIVLLTSTNYFQCKPHMKDLSRSKGLYRTTLGTKTAPDDEEKIAKWD